MAENQIGTLHWAACSTCRCWDRDSGVCLVDSLDWKIRCDDQDVFCESYHPEPGGDPK